MQKTEFLNLLSKFRTSKQTQGAWNSLDFGITILNCTWIIFEGKFDFYSNFQLSSCSHVNKFFAGSSQIWNELFVYTMQIDFSFVCSYQTLVFVKVTVAVRQLFCYVITLNPVFIQQLFSATRICEPTIAKTRHADCPFYIYFLRDRSVRRFCTARDCRCITMDRRITCQWCCRRFRCTVHLRRPRAPTGTNTFEPLLRPSLHPLVRDAVRDWHRSVFPVFRHCLVLPALARSLRGLRHVTSCCTLSLDPVYRFLQEAGREIAADRLAANSRTNEQINKSPTPGRQAYQLRRARGATTWFMARLRRRMERPDQWLPGPPMSTRCQLMTTTARDTVGCPSTTFLFRLRRRQTLQRWTTQGEDACRRMQVRVGRVKVLERRPGTAHVLPVLQSGAVPFNDFC